MRHAGAAQPLEGQLAAAGLPPQGPCGPLSGRPELLRESPLLEGFSAAEADVLGALMLRVRAQPGQRLIREGEVGDWMLIVLSGTVDVLKRRVDAVPGEPDVTAETRLAVLREGAVLGEMSMFDGEPRYASCVALTEVEAAVLGRAAVARLIATEPAVAAKLLVKLMQLLAQRLRNTSSQLVKRIGQAQPAPGPTRR